MSCICISASNIALGRPAYQSSVYLGATASRSVDGYKTSDFFEKSCSCTDNEPDPWFLVELDRSYVIHSVALTNRGDCCGKYNTIEMHLYGHR